MKLGKKVLAFSIAGILVLAILAGIGGDLMIRTFASKSTAAYGDPVYQGSTYANQGITAVQSDGTLGTSSNLTFNGTTLDTNGIPPKAPTGRVATIVVAASDATTTEKTQADYICDGTADNVEIQAAIDAAPTNGAEIHLSSGTFYISTTIHVYRNIWIIGSGLGQNGGTQLRMGSNGDMFYAYPRDGDAQSIGFVRFANMDIEGLNYTGNGVRINFSDCMVDHCYIEHFVGSGVYLEGGYYHHVEENWLENNTTGLLIAASIGQNLITNNIIKLSTGDNIDDRGAYNQFINNIIADAQHSGYSNRSGSNIVGTVLFGNKFMHNGLAAANTYFDIDINGSYKTIEGNIFRQGTNLKNLIRIYDGGSNVIIGNSMIDASVGSKISISDPTNNSLGNIIRSNAGFNPLGSITNPVNNTNGYIIGVGGNTTTVAASNDYTASGVDLFVNSTNSGDSNATITIKDPAGNAIRTLSGASLPVYQISLPVGYKINWGAFTGAVPTVTVFGN